MAKARPYHLKVAHTVYGKKNAERLAAQWEGQGITAKVLPGIDPKCTANHFQPGFGGHIDAFCPQCKGWVYV
jgi:hypothetical protein